MRALGISVHTGWAVCVIVAGSLRRPEILANETLEILDDSERFCFHRAVEMTPAEAHKWMLRVRSKALGNAERALKSLIAREVGVCAIVARQGDAGDLAQVLASHARIHSAEGYFYRDVLREACTVPVSIIPPSSIDVTQVGKLAAAPWGKDQKLAALAAWSVIKSSAPPPDH